MLPNRPKVVHSAGDDGSVVTLSGGWVVSWAGECESLLGTTLAKLKGQPFTVNLDGVERMDTAGAWVIFSLLRNLGGASELVQGGRAEQRELINTVADYNREEYVAKSDRMSVADYLELTGKRTRTAWHDFLAVLHILGSMASVLATVLINPRRLRPVSIAVQFQKTCIGAVPIIALMSFLIGGIIAQQGGFYLRQFGADIFVVDLTGILVLREIGVILTAIMVAGRSGSAFTAEIGSMKMREEIDALHVIGLRVTEVLILPRLIALMLALPALVFISDLAALLGAGLICWIYLDILPAGFIEQLKIAITPETLMVGLIKAPFMALIVGLIACVEGMKVEGSTESLGTHTTMSVVKAIFLVILVDGIFAIFFASIGV
ncbi:MlaE family ABC transporter permease [Pseudovibrio flavus]|uniref:MlaE family ABC transporter permease n=1 Tax=Pseudovibrio flavus TaxID=2529854 RepID=UPI0035272ACE